MTQLTWEGPIPTSGRQRRGVLAPVLGLIALGICGLVVLGLVASTVGVAGVIVGALCALVPVAVVVATFLWIDRWEPEPPRLLLLAFLWGLLRRVVRAGDQFECGADRGRGARPGQR